MTGAGLLLHIGYHKTATTWMQQRLFTPEHGYLQIADHADMFRHIVQPHGFRFDPNPLKALLAEHQSAVLTGETPVISSEILSGHPFQGGHESDVYAERLHKIVPQARILISIRSQMRILPSVYMQYLLRGGTMPYKQFFRGTEAIGYFGFTPQHFEYDRLVGHYQQLFGAENVYVLTQESLQADMDAAAAGLAAFAQNRLFSGLQASARNVHAASYPEYASAVLRRINHLQASDLNPAPILRLGQTPKGLYRAAGYLLRRPPFTTLFGAQKPVSKHVRQQFAGYFTASNARLAKITQNALDLSGYD